MPPGVKFLPTLLTNVFVRVPVPLAACAPLTFSKAGITTESGAAVWQLARTDLAFPRLTHRNSFMVRFGRVRAVAGSVFTLKLLKLRCRILAVR